MQKQFDIQRRVVAHKTVESWDTIPHAGIVLELDVTEVLSFVRKLRDLPEFHHTRITLNTVMLKIIAESIKASPDMNAVIRYNKRTSAGEMFYRNTIDIAIPLIAACNRTITPVLRDIGNKTLLETCLAMEQLKARALNTDIDLLLMEAGVNDTWERLYRGEIITVFRRLYANFLGKNKIKMPSRAVRTEYAKRPASDRLVAEDLLDATTLVSNAGSVMPGLRCHGVILEIIPPQLTAMVLVGVRKMPVVETDGEGNDTIVIRDILPITLCIDHRALDLEHITGFLKEITRLCAHPEGLWPS